MSSPPLFVDPSTARFGEIAPLNEYSVALDTLPFCTRPSGFGSISYQRTSAPAPPAVVCCTQIAPGELSTPLGLGSRPLTACVGRESLVSSNLFEPVNPLLCWA